MRVRLPRNFRSINDSCLCVAFVLFMSTHNRIINQGRVAETKTYTNNCFYIVFLSRQIVVIKKKLINVNKYRL